MTFLQTLPDRDSFHIEWGRTARKDGGILVEVPQAVLRDAYTRSGLTYSEVARNAGWEYGKGTRKPDTRRVSRYLAQRYVQYETAVNFVRACDLDPVDYGL